MVFLASKKRMKWPLKMYTC